MTRETVKFRRVKHRRKKRENLQGLTELADAYCQLHAICRLTDRCFRVEVAAAVRARIATILA